MATAPVIEFDKIITPDGLEYTLEDCNNKFFVSGLTGRGMPPLKFLTQSSPRQIGETYLDVRLKPRTISMMHRVQGSDRQAYWDNRAELLNILRPNRGGATFQLATLYKKLADGTERSIDVTISSGPAFQGEDSFIWDEVAFTEMLRFIAPDPLFYDPTQASETFTTTSPQAEWQLPTQWPIVFDITGKIDASATITYVGNWLTYPVLEITGAMDGATITNTTTGEVISTVYAIPAGHVLTIDLSQGDKTVTDQTGQNLIGTITTDSDLATFHIAPDPEAPGGVQTITVFAVNASVGASVVVKYYNKYIGI